MAKKEASEAVEGGSSKKLIIIIALVVVLLAGAGIGAYLFLGGEEEMTPEQEQAEMARKANMVGPMVSIETFIVNIQDNEESRFLKAAITFEVDGEAASMEVGQRMAQIKDAILLLISNKTFSELSDLQGKIQLRAELMNRINSILVNGKVKHIYFTDFVVQ